MSTVEVLIKTFPGGERYLEETVESFRAQGVEPVVVNDDRRNYDVWNEAFQNCKADYLSLAHHDDVYLPSYISEMTAYLDAHPTVVAAFCLDYLIDDKGRRTGQTYLTWEPQDTYNFKDLYDLTFQHGNILRCETVMYRVALVKDLQFPDQSVCERAHDTQFWFTMADKHPIGIVTKPLVKYRVHTESDTQKHVTLHELGHFKALEFASKLRPQDCDFIKIVSAANTCDSVANQGEAERVRKRDKGVEFLVCHEPPEAAGTGVVVAHRVRTLNKDPDGIIRFYVYPSAEPEHAVIWTEGIPSIRCPTDGFSALVKKMNPAKIEYHHLLRWPLHIIEEPCAVKELWLHDSFLWCAQYHSVNKDGVVCNEPEPKKCSDCSGESVEFLDKKKAFLNEAVGKLDRFVANSEYTARYAKANLGIDCEVIPPSGEPLRSYGRRKRVGYFGGVGVVKGTPVLLKAWRILQKDGDCPQLLMFCDTPAEWRKGRKIAGFDDVLVMGAYSRSDLGDLCNLVDLVVVPSINESYGLVKREIESLGVPVIATLCGGLDGTIPSNDPFALAQAIRTALKNQEALELL